MAAVKLWRRTAVALRVGVSRSSFEYRSAGNHRKGLRLQTCHELVQPGALGGHRAAGCRLRSGCRGRTDGRRHLAGPARAWAGTHCRGPTVRTARSQHHRRVLVVLPVVEAAVTGMLAEDIAGEEDDRHDEHGSGGNGYPRRGFEHLGGLVGGGVGVSDVSLMCRMMPWQTVTRLCVPYVAAVSARAGYRPGTPPWLRLGVRAPELRV